MTEDDEQEDGDEDEMSDAEPVDEVRDDVSDDELNEDVSEEVDSRMIELSILRKVDAVPGPAVRVIILELECFVNVSRTILPKFSSQYDSSNSISISSTSIFCCSIQERPRCVCASEGGAAAAVVQS